MVWSRLGLGVYLCGILILLMCWKTKAVWWFGLGLLVLIAFAGLAVDTGLWQKDFYWPRLTIWYVAWEMFLDEPLVGHGPGLFKDLFVSYTANLGIDLKTLVDQRAIPWAHSLIFEQLAERGLAGLITFLLLFYVAASRLWFCFINKQVIEKSILALYALIASFIAFCLVGIAEATLMRLWVTVVLFTLLGVISAISNIQLRLITPPAEK
jgi:O-antigen ligase